MGKPQRSETVSFNYRKPNNMFRLCIGRERDGERDKEREREMSRESPTFYLLYRTVLSSSATMDPGRANESGVIITKV